MMQLSAGYTLQGGKYLINHALGSQGLGVSYRATVAQVGQAVVIKTLNPNLHQHPAFDQLRQRFIDRARLLARSQHPSLVRVFDFFQEGEFPFVVMEFVPGKSLAELIPPGHGLAPADAMNALQQVASALSIAHRYQLIHGNLQPQHLIRRSGTSTIVVVGFSAHAGQPELVNWPIDPDVLAYRAPEGQMQLPSADLYALGALFYHALSGHPPIVTSPHADLTEKLPLLALLTPAQQQVIRRTLAIDPSQRPPTAEAFLALLHNPRQPLPPHPKTAVQLPNPAVPPQAVPRREVPLELIEATIEPPRQPPISPTPQFAPAPFLTEPLPVDPSAKPLAAPIPAPLPRMAPAPIEATVAIAPAPVPTQISPQMAKSPMMSSPTYPNVTPYPKRAFVLTGTIAAVIGIGFGLALRFGASNPSGTSIFHAGQSFPERDWKGATQPPDANEVIPIESSKSNPNPKNITSQEIKAPFPEPIESPLPRRDLETPPPSAPPTSSDLPESKTSTSSQSSTPSDPTPQSPSNPASQPAPAPRSMTSDPVPPPSESVPFTTSTSDPAPPAAPKSLNKGDLIQDPPPPAIGSSPKAK